MTKNGQPFDSFEETLADPAASPRSVPFSFTPDDEGTYLVTLIARDAAGAQTTVPAQVTIQVTNGNPVAAILNAPSGVTEGTTVNLASRITDPGLLDTFQGYQWTVTRDGQPFTLPVETPTNEASFTFIPGSEGLYRVSLTVQDNAGAMSASAEAIITVVNVPPADVAIQGLPPDGVREGQTVVLTAGFTDPGSETFAYLWTVSRDGQPFGDPGADSTFPFTPPDDGSYSISLTVGERLAAASATRQVDVGGIAPTGTPFVSLTAIDEGSPFTFGLIDVGDPSAEDVADGLRFSFDLDGDAVYEIVGVAAATQSVTLTQSGRRTLRARVRDADGLSTSYALAVQIGNVAPAVMVSQASVAVSQGQTAQLAGSFADPGDDRWRGLATITKADDPQFRVVAPVVLNEDKTFRWPYAFGAAGSYTVTFDVTDDEPAPQAGGQGGSALLAGEESHTVLVTVGNVLPVIDPLGTAAVVAGRTFTRQVSFSDPGNDVWTWSVDYGDGGGFTPYQSTDDPNDPADSPKVFELSHVYAQAGDYQVQVRVRDQPLAATAGEAMFMVHVAADQPPTVVVPIPDLTVRRGTSAWFDYANLARAFSDPDNPADELVFRATSSNSALLAVPIGEDHTLDLLFAPSQSGTSEITVQATDPAGGVATETFVVTVSIDEIAISIAADNAVRPEGNSDSTPFTFMLTRAGPTAGTTTVSYAVTGSGTHPADAADFGGTLPSGSVTFDAGQTSKSLTIHISGDWELEADEGFIVTLSSPPANGQISTATASGTILNDDLPRLLATALAPTASGFAVQFNHDVDGSVLNLYDQGGALGPADLTVVGTTVGAVRGSLVLDASRRQATFIKTGGVLAADTYTVTLRSGATGFRDSGGNLLDGDGNGTAGDDWVTTFTVAPPPASAITVSLPDLTRGYGQPVNVPANLLTAGIPLMLSNGVGVSGMDLTLHYDPALLEIQAFAVASGLAANGVEAQLTFPSAGTAILQIDGEGGFASTAGFNDVIQSNDTTNVRRAIGQIDVPNIPALPTGPMPPAAGGPDPQVFIPQNLRGVPGGTITVPVRMRVSEPLGITLGGMDVVIEFDATRLTLRDARLGTLLAGTDLSGTINQLAAGKLIYTADSLRGTPLYALDTTGDLMTLTFAIATDASPGSVAINLLSTLGSTRTALFDNELGELTLTPPPTNSASDPIDGVVTIGTPLAADIVDVAPDSRSTEVSSMQIVFNAAVTGFDLADLALTRDGGSNLLTMSQTLTTADHITWTLSNLSALTAASGSYEVKLNYLNTYGSGPIRPMSGGEGEYAGPLDLQGREAATPTGMTDHAADVPSAANSVVASTRPPREPQAVGPVSPPPASRTVPKVTRPQPAPDKSLDLELATSELEEAIAAIVEEVAQAWDSPRQGRTFPWA